MGIAETCAAMCKKAEEFKQNGGEPLYCACGYVPVSRFQSGLGDVVPMCLMTKVL